MLTLSCLDVRASHGPTVDLNAADGDLLDDVLSITEEVFPKTMHADDVIVRTSLGGVCGTDLEKISLALRVYKTNPFGDYKKIFTMGHEAIGTVVEDFSGAFSVGDRVAILEQNNCRSYAFSPECMNCKLGLPIQCTNKRRFDRNPNCFGGWSEYFCRSSYQLARVPDSIDDFTAVLLEPALIAESVFNRISNGGFADILIIGGGTIAQILGRLISQAKGCSLSTLSNYPFQKSTYEKFCRGEHYLSTAADIDYLKSRLKSNRLAVVDFGTDPDFLGRVVDVIGARSAIFMLSFHANQPINFKMVVDRELTIVGHHGYGSDDVKHFLGSNPGSSHLRDSLNSGAVHLEDLVTNVFPISQYKHAILNSLGLSTSVATNNKPEVFRTIFQF